MIRQPQTLGRARIYRLLLRAYPAAFRHAYGPEMVTAFQRQRHEQRYAAPIFGTLVFWLDILTDLSTSATRRRLASRSNESRFPRKRESLMGTLLQDLKYAIRGLRHSPGLTAAALLTLAIGIGANTAMFSLVNGVLLKPYAYPDPDRLVSVWDSNPGRGWDTFSVSPLNFLDYRQQSAAFDSMTSHYPSSTTLIEGTGEPERVTAAYVGPDFFQTFAIEPTHGRVFGADENNPGNTSVAILSARLWHRRFASAPDVVGSTISLNGVPVTIVGVFAEPNAAPDYAELWVPEEISLDTIAGRGAHFFRVVGRMSPGVTLDGAREDLRVVAARLAEEYPVTNEGWTTRVNSLHEDRVGHTRASLLMLSGAVALVLLIACANIANLLLARATQRQGEIAVRVALGAGRRRIFSQVIAESLMLSLLGGALGVAVAFGVTRAVATLAPDSLPRLGDVGIDPTVLGYATLVSVLTGLLFGIVPALQSAGSDVNATLKNGGRSASVRSGVRSSLVVAEVALAVVVVVGAGLLMRSLSALMATDPGFQVDHRVSARIGLPSDYDTPEKHAAFFTELTEGLAGAEGIEAVGLTSRLPMGGDFSISFTIEGRPESAVGQGPSGEMRIVSAGFFDALSIPLVRGRMFDDRDRLDAQPVVVINRRLADVYFPDEDPIGQRLRIGYAHARDAERVREIVGIVDNTHEFGLGRGDTPIYYVSHRQTPEPGLAVVVHTSGPIDTAVAALRREVGSLDPNLPVYRVSTLEQHVADNAGPRRFRAVLLGSFAGVALLLASIGIYGVMAYSVAQRTRELGIRIALGAARVDVLSMVLNQGLRLAAIGIALGSLAAFAVGRLLRDLLFGISPADPLTFGFVAAFLMAIAAMACYLPARRATRVDPNTAMRAE